MTDTTLSSKQPSGSGLDYADPTKFKFQISKLPRVEFNCIQANIPGITLTEINQPTRLMPVRIPGNDMTFEDLWLNCYETMNWQEKHMHLPSKWSGVYYAIFDEEEHSPTHFYSPNEKLIAINPSCGIDTLIPKVKEGDMIIFPSWLEHAAPLNKSSKLRATISFNFYFDNELT